MNDQHARLAGRETNWRRADHFENSIHLLVRHLLVREVPDTAATQQEGVQRVGRGTRFGRRQFDEILRRESAPFHPNIPATAGHHALSAANAARERLGSVADFSVFKHKHVGMADCRTLATADAFFIIDHRNRFFFQIVTHTYPSFGLFQLCSAGSRTSAFPG
jgi:hypothetical protein